VTLAPGFPQLLATALRLGTALVRFFPHTPIALLVTAVTVSVSEVAHTSLQRLQAAPREDTPNTVPHIRAEDASSSWMLLTNTNPLMTAIPLIATRRPTCV
jgi:hypothetical protein